MTPKSLIILVGLVPIIVVVAFEWARLRHHRRVGFAQPVSAEGIRWAQYFGAAYLLGYAAIMLAVLDARGVTLPLLVTLTSICLASGTVLWFLGVRYHAAAPRLADMRHQCYRAQCLLRSRDRQVTALLWHLSGHSPEAARQTSSAQLLLDRLEAQMACLQHALSTPQFVSRLAVPAYGVQTIGSLTEEQRLLLHEVSDFLTRTAPSRVPASTTHALAVTVR